MDYFSVNVVQSDGVDVKPDFKVDVEQLNKGFKHFTVHDGKANSFKVSIIINENETVTGNNSKNTVNISSAGGYMEALEQAMLNDEKYLNQNNFKNFSKASLLNYFMRNLTPLYVKSDIVGIADGVLYVITENSSRKQTHRGGYSVWDLTFTKYNELKKLVFKKTSSGAQKAIKQAQAKKKKATSTKTAAVASKTNTMISLRKCNRNVLVYSKTKKVVACVKTLQTLLNQEGLLKDKSQIDGWYGNVTKQAVKDYQTKYAKKYGLASTGHVNLKTYNVMSGQAKLNNKTTTKKK